MKNKYLPGAILLLSLWPTVTFAQEKESKTFGKSLQGKNCATYEYGQFKDSRNPNAVTDAQFEQWLSAKTAAVKAKRLQKDGNDDIITIPVVVHVVHDGDALGVDENITDAQILSQIEVLNQDYRRMEDTPGYNDNPVGADTKIEFCLAQRNPDGMPTTGIVRHLNSWEYEWQISYFDKVIKPATQWDPDRYLNIWVVRGMHHMGNMLLGYAQFPKGNVVEGLPPYSLDSDYSDGVVIDYRAFGSPLIYPEGNYFDEIEVRGRVASHEIGHYLGLRHIWGDGNNCHASDFCDDTPAQLTPTLGLCPTDKDTCPAEGMDMIQNYMDYTAETCQNIFTQDQSDRMHAVLENAPMRKHIGSSIACAGAESNTHDGSLRLIDFNIDKCSNTFAPTLRLFNTGSETITSAIIHYTVEGQIPFTSFEWSGSLAHGQETTVTLPAVSVNTGTHAFELSLGSINDTDDQSHFNDTKIYTLKTAQEFTAESIAIIIVQDQYGSDTTWTLKDSNDNIVVSGGPYQDAENPTEVQPHVVETAVVDGECYTFSISDASGDGICCDYGQGVFSIMTAPSQMIAYGGVFNNADAASFKINNTLGVQDYISATISLYPNPARYIININSTDATNLPDGYTVYNALGQIMAAGSMENVTETVDTSKYASGIYFVKLHKNGQGKTLQFIKQ